MQIAGEYVIDAPPDVVWAALHDPASLRRSIPGCQMLERTGANEYTSAVRAEIGPVGALFKGKATLSDVDPPNNYTLTGRVQGGPAGFAKGSAKVRLAPEGEGTRITYSAAGKPLLESIAAEAKLDTTPMPTKAKGPNYLWFLRICHRLQCMKGNRATVLLSTRQVGRVMGMSHDRIADFIAMAAGEGLLKKTADHVYVPGGVGRCAEFRVDLSRFPLAA